jgi:hypothetical protein
MSVWQIGVRWLKWTGIWGLVCVVILGLGLLVVRLFGLEINAPFGVLIGSTFVIGGLVAIPITRAQIREHGHREG